MTGDAAARGSKARAIPTLARALLTAWRESMASEEWHRLDPAQLRLWSAGMLTFGRRRRPHETLLRVRCVPGVGEPGSEDGNGHTFIELVTEDMPFLLSTLQMALAESGCALDLLVHPILRVVRDRAGHVRQLRSVATGGETGGTGEAGENPRRARGDHRPLRESWQLLRIGRSLDAEQCADIDRQLRRAIADVRLVFTDWQAMREAVLGLCKDIERHPPPLPADVVSESKELLRYMEAHHFTFLGYAESRLQSRAGGIDMIPVPGSELGVLRGRPSTHQRRRLPANFSHTLRQSNLLFITKANLRSTVHRPGYLDYIGIKRFDRRGRVVGEARIVGLWTSSAYSAHPNQVPWLRLKLQRIASHFPFAAASYDARRLGHVLATLPRDELFQASVADLTRCVRAVLVLHDRSHVRLIVRRDEFRRFWTCLVYLPRDRFDSTVQSRIEALLRTAFNGTWSETSLALGNSALAQMYVVVRVPADATPRLDTPRLEHDIAATIVSWRDHLRRALRSRFGETQARVLDERFGGIFPASYRQDAGAALAVDDILDLEQLDSSVESMQLRLYRPAGQNAQRVHLRVLKRGEALAISDVLPTLEHFGLRVIAERPYNLVSPDARATSIQDFELEHANGHAVRVSHVDRELIAAFRAVRAGTLENDGFNRLLIAAELSAGPITVLRACCRYLLQTGIPFSQNYMERVLAAYPAAARDLALLFEARLAPERTATVNRSAVQLERRVRRAIGAVASADDDRILRAFLSVVLATLRTNYFQRPGGQPRPCLSLKLDPTRIPGLPRPLPAFEIFVYSPRVEGVHLRKGPIARGGIRWSERPEDFRTEVLGLMKAQNVKNTLIVPVGAKGGFVARRLAQRATREAQQSEVVECYRTFIRGLLDVTDNIVGGRIVPPAQVHRRDGDDPYLVVAADKGTATFSDVANAISAEYHFWLGDAFASGGSAGYDHKKMGITARGAWECIKRHFREFGHDIQRQAFTVAGIGDMSGDVFGNGMLLSRQIRLVAAFNHQHIFLDPHPDAARSFRERARLFRLPRSGWNDYDRTTLSRGGAIFERSAKQVELSAEAQALLDLPQRTLSPTDLIRAILRMRVDLLWNGGIGTYVKAEDERHGEIGDRTNDALRINGKELRARVVGEGGNLGFSQRGRIEYALAGGRLNADFIDNSAGVNTSDVEVNLKILLDAHAPKPLPRARRNQLLRGATREVAGLVLRNNYLQSLAISLLEQRAAEELGDHQQLLRWLERHADLDRHVESLPTDEEIEERRRQGRGLTRPELALLLAYGKIALNHALTASGSARDPYLARELERYFPEIMQRRYRERIAHHRLRTQIINTANTNSIVNRVGPALLMQAGELPGVDAADLARAYTIARDSAELRELWNALEGLDGRIAATDQYQGLLATSDYLRDLTRWVLLHREEFRDCGAAVARLQPALHELSRVLPGALAGLDRARYLERCEQLRQRGFDDRLAESLAVLEPMRVAPDLAQLRAQLRTDARAVAQAHFGLGARLGLDWLHAAVARLPATGSWQHAARTRLAREAAAAHLRMSAAALTGRARGAALASLAYERWQQILRDLRAQSTLDLAALAVGVEAAAALAAEPAALFARLLAQPEPAASGAAA